MTKKFDLKVMNDATNRVFRMLWNSYYFFVMYANIDKFKVKIQKSEGGSNLLDKWIVSELQILIKNVDEKLANYDMYNSANEIEKFVDNLSNWYIRRNRKRFWKSEDDVDKANAYQTLYTVLMELAKLMAPFTPFIAEEIYKNLAQTLNGKRQTLIVSVHLQDFPVADEKLIDVELSDKMAETRNTITVALQLRAKNGIKVRQPLAELRIKNYELKDEFLEIIKEEVNVKKVVQNNKFEETELDIEITGELKLEGQAREIIRFIQEMRKAAGYEVDNRIIVGYSGMSQVFEKFGNIIAKEVLANELKSEKIEKADLEKEFVIDGEKIQIRIKKG
jgi:isoleucyl-tRNA synthetase